MPSRVSRDTPRTNLVHIDTEGEMTVVIVEDTVEMLKKFWLTVEPSKKLPSNGTKLAIKK